MKFKDFDDAGRKLSVLVRDVLTPDSVLLGVPTCGVAVAVALADELGVTVTVLDVTRDDSGVHIRIDSEVCSGREAVVIDDGIETGTTARAIAVALREAGATRIVLAVPVCPREAEADLRRRYDDVLALDRPLVRRSLRWHYETFA
ncbi:MAG: phosphoribosyltransferase family protein [Actinomycetes bacterium]